MRKPPGRWTKEGCLVGQKVGKCSNSSTRGPQLPKGDSLPALRDVVVESSRMDGRGRLLAETPLNRARLASEMALGGNAPTLLTSQRAEAAWQEM